MKNRLFAFLILTVTNLTTASAAPYTLTKYDDPAFAQFCYSEVAVRYNVHFDAAVSDGDWGLCGFSDRTQGVGPGSILANSVLYHRTNGVWTYNQKGNGYFDTTVLEEQGVPANVAQRLVSKFQSSICFRGDVPGTTRYCAYRSP